MPSSSAQRCLTERDIDVLAALDMAPLTVVQLLKLSQVFDRSFTQPRLVRRRMQRLVASGLVQQHRYATNRRGEPPAYYQLTLEGYRMLHGPQARPPTRRYLQPVGWSKQRHTQHLADFLVHLQVVAHARGVQVVDFRPENTVRLQVGDECLFPDGTFQLALPSGRRLSYCLELDCGSERIATRRPQTDSIQRKLRLYARCALETARRFRVILVTTASAARSEAMAAMARQYELDSSFHLFYLARIEDFLDTDDALLRPCFLTSHGDRAGLLQAVGRYEQPRLALFEMPTRTTAWYSGFLPEG